MRLLTGQSRPKISEYTWRISHLAFFHNRVSSCIIQSIRVVPGVKARL